MSELNPILKQYAAANKPSDIFAGCEALTVKAMHIQNVLRYTQKLYDTMSPGLCIDSALLFFCAEHHDDGRVNQYEILGKFDDRTLSHNVLGVERFDKWIQQNHFVAPFGTCIQIFRDVMLYHGRLNLCITAESKPYVELITAADDIDNAASCVSYLIREINTDAKSYVKSAPNKDQKLASDFVFEHFANGEKFDKMKYCTTYAEYVLFAATLMTSCIKKYNFAKDLLNHPGYGYPSILEGYKHVFEYALTPDLAKKAYDVLFSYAQ